MIQSTGRILLLSSFLPAVYCSPQTKTTAGFTQSLLKQNMPVYFTDLFASDKQKELESTGSDWKCCKN